MIKMHLFAAIIVASWTLSTAAAPVSSAPVSAASTHTTLKTLLKNKKFESDHRITDLELKADAGSLSRYSLKFVLGYSGPQINKLYADEQPNPNHSPGTYLTSLSGSIGLRYRLSPKAAMSLSTGYRAYTPFSGVQQQDVDNPSIGYDRTFRFGPVQSWLSLYGSATTTKSYRKSGQIASTGLSQTFKYQIGPSRWILGSKFSLTYFAFQRDYRSHDGKVSNFYFNWIPSIEYRLANSLNFNTSWAVPYANLRRAHSLTTWDHQMTNQRVGLGWAITRDIYINPYVNFFPVHFSWNTASLSFNTVFSVF